MTTNQSISQSSNKLPVARLSPASLLLLIDTDPTPHLLLDIRPPAAQSPLPFPLPDSTEYRRAPIFGKERTELLNFLKSEFAEPKDPKRDPRKTHIVVVFSVNGNEAQTQDAVETLIWFGFEKLAVLEGGLAAFDVGSAEGRRAVPTILSPSASALSIEEAAQAKSSVPPPTLPGPPTYISRDALAVLLKNKNAAVLDVRRQDERANFGMIDPNGGWICVDELPGILEASKDNLAPLSEKWKIDVTNTSGKPLVIHCRTHRRAGWAAHLLNERGIKTLVLKDGVWGWGFDEKVLAYPSFEEWDPLPEGKPGKETPDWSKGEKELKGLLGK